MDGAAGSEHDDQVGAGGVATDDVDERVRADKVAVAIDLLRLATDALELASGE